MRSTHLFARGSMCYLPEWNIVNNNNKYTEYKWCYKWDANNNQATQWVKEPQCKVMFGYLVYQVTESNLGLCYKTFYNYIFCKNHNKLVC